MRKFFGYVIIVLLLFSFMNLAQAKPKKKKMLHLLRLIPEKKSLYLAVKELNARNIDEIIKCFEKLELSPITISKHKKYNHLPNLYTYIYN